jgi:hypothetical protein
MSWNESEQYGNSPQFVGRDAVDEHGAKIGTVTDVVSDDDSGAPAWAVVSLGMLSAERYVPLGDAYQTEEGRIVLAFDRRTVKGSPRARRDHVLARSEADEIRQYYGVAA